MSTFKIDPFFPDKNLNPQGWITDFITSRLLRVDKQRSDLASVLYDENLSDEAKKLINNNDLVKEIESARKRSPKDKSIYLNPLYYDAVERNTSISAKVVENERELKEYFKYMINIKPNELSSYVPYVRIKFGYKEPNEKTFNEVEVPFIQNLKTEVSSILADKFSRGQGAGITGITADKSFPGLGLTLNVSVTVKYFFSSITTITKKISNPNIPENLNFTYTKLFSFLPSMKEKLFLEYGYNAYPDDENLRITSSKSIVYSKSTIESIIKAEKKRIALAYKSHKLNIQEDGTITVDVNYMAESEANFFQKNDVTSPSLDYISKIQNESLRSIFANYAELNKKYYKIEDEIKNLSEQTQLQQIGSDKKKLDKINKIKQAKKKESVKISKDLTIIKEKISPYIKDLILDALIKRNQVFSISFTSQKKDSEYNIKSYLNLVKFNKDTKKQEFVQIGEPFVVKKNLNDYKNFNISVLENNTVGLTKENLFQQILTNLFDGVEKGSNKFGYITFFPLKALIAIMYEFLPSDGDPTLKYKIPYLCFGNAIARSFGKEYSINIGDILVEMETFSLWLHKNYVQKNRTEYSLSAFMTDLVEELVPEILYKRNTGFYRQNSLGTIRHLNYHKKPNMDEKIIESIYKKTPNFADLRSIFSAETEKDAEPMIYYTQMLNPLNDYTSPYHKKYIAKRVLGSGYSADDDSALGIPHVFIGTSRGLIKNINFNVIEQQYLGTALVKQAMVDGETRLPRYAHNINIDMFGNNLFNQAGFLVVPPMGIEGESDIVLGLTGYYLVTKVSDSLSIDGGYSTSVTAISHADPTKEKSKAEMALLKDHKQFPELKEYIEFSVDEYIKDLLSLDPSTLKALGVTANPVKQDKKTNEEKKQDSKKQPKRDRKEKVGAK